MQFLPDADGTRQRQTSAASGPVPGSRIRPVARNRPPVAHPARFSKVFMTVRVRLFARARDLAGVDAIDVDLSDRATVGEMRRALGNLRPAFKELLSRCAIAVNEDFVGDDVIVTETSEIAVIPPVSGGAAQPQAAKT